jgi:lysophospholipase L1-like esterase
MGRRIAGGAGLVLAGMALLAPLTVSGAEPDPARWSKAIAAFDRGAQPAKGGIVFVGSSSIRRWDLEKWFPDFDVVNRGFGGSHLSDCNHYLESLVLKHEPRIVVLYAGDNDIASGKSPERVFEDFQEFSSRIHKRLPATRIVYLPIKPSLKRWHLVEPMKKANALIAAYALCDRRIVSVNTFDELLGDDGRPRRELFAADGLHLNETGYKAWTTVLTPHLRVQEWLYERCAAP